MTAAADPTVGLLVLADLDALYAWSPRRGPALLDLLGEPAGDLLAPRFDPPPALVLVVTRDTLAAPLLRRGWLARAAALVLVVDGSSTVADDDPELAELLAAELAETRAALPNIVDVRAWDGRDPAVLQGALARARELAPRDWPAPPVPTPRPALAPGPWLRWSPWLGVMHDGRIERESAIAQLVQGLCMPAGRPTLLAEDGEALDLQDGARRPGPAWTPRHTAVAPDGARTLSKVPGDHQSPWQIQRPGHPPRVFPAPWGRPIAWDPWDRVAWIGHRCRYYWLCPDGAYWTPSDHDWPCGHSKKLWGYEDNDPLWIHLAPDASACLSMYGHDALLTAGLPVRWQHAGAFVLAVRGADPWRALLFAHEPDGFPADPRDPHDDDARHIHPTVTLGPDDAHRYAVSLERATWRIRGDTSEPLGGPDDAWLLFDRNHDLVRRGSGRLLAGWHDHVVVLEHGRLRREHLITCTRTDLGPTDRPIAAAVAVPGTPNVVLLDPDGPHVRLV